MEKMQQELEGHADVGGGDLHRQRWSDGLAGPLPCHGRFPEQHPKVQYQLYTNHAEHVKERLEQGLLDFGFCWNRWMCQNSTISAWGRGRPGGS